MMNFGFLSIPWFGLDPKRDSELTLASTSALLEQPKQKAGLEIRLWGWTLVSVPPCAVNGNDKNRAPTTINKGLKRRARQRGAIEPPNGGTSIRFRPYVCKVPWHTGARAFLSQLFPRYGHYCGPNWSSGKDGGSLVWDRRPIDWLDFCCYCHDIGYDTHDQEKLLKADLAFLECLEKPHMSTKGDVRIAHLYRTMCTTAGLKNILIPYRRHLVKLQYGQPLIDFGWLRNVRRRNWNFQKT
ncbi:Phospholipase A2 family protein isoform 2 [Theobroma cacao]|uniref:Phospholipase A2 family protein isoform 2 n=1 Tax=Theobroma cacao TaxID=3641 RepID=A0A061GSQ5_THECC|nr:Phospholipase A2 family protein isoform 2 [Theobroma cacao]